MVDPIITEEYREFAAGRGKKLVIVIKGVIPQQKKPKEKNPNRFCAYYLKSNPNPIQLAIYRGKRSYPILYPEKRRISKEELDKMLAGLIILRKNMKILKDWRKPPEKDGNLQLSTKCGGKVWEPKQDFYFDVNLYVEIKEQAKRFKNWFNKKPKKPKK